MSETPETNAIALRHYAETQALPRDLTFEQLHEHAVRQVQELFAFTCQLERRCAALEALARHLCKLPAPREDYVEHRIAEIRNNNG